MTTNNVAAPRGIALLLACLSALSLPGMSTFVSEFLVIAGTWSREPGVAAVAARHGVPVIAFAGRLGDGADELVGRGFVAVQSITRGPGTLADALREGPANLERAVATALRIRALG